MERNLQPHLSGSSLSPAKGRTTLMTTVLAAAEGSTQTLQMVQHKKLEIQLITEIAAWLIFSFFTFTALQNHFPLP